MKIAVACESTCDLTSEMITKNNIYVIPFHVVLGDEEFLDDENLTSEALFDYTEKTGTLPKTAAITVGEYEDFFKSILSENDAVVFIGLSSQISSTQGNAILAANNLKNVYVIDSKSLSTGIGLLVMSAVDKVNQNMEVKEIVSKLKEEVECVQASFVLNTLKFMHKGGRCSVFSLLGAQALGIKPKIALLSDGKMAVDRKYRGKLEIVLDKYCDDLLAEHNPDLTRVFVTYSSRPACTDKIIEKLKRFGFENVYETTAGATVSTHCGPETLGVLFMNKERNED